MKKNKVIFQQDSAPTHSLITMMTKIAKFTLLARYRSQRLLFVHRHQQNACISNEEVMAETEPYFVDKDKSFFKKGIKIVEKLLFN